jgi:hypothetical protein
MRTFVLALGLCLCSARAVNAQKLQDFTGTWKVDPEKVQEKAILLNNPANGQEIPPPPPSDHKHTLEQIRQSGEVLRISGGGAGTTAVYTIDPSGKEVSDPIPDSPGIVRIATTSWNDGRLVTKWKMERNGEEFMLGTDLHSITPERTLLVTREIESPRHRAHVRLVLETDH